MKYIYKNVTHESQSVLLASKDQTFVNTKMFHPGSTLELDYPGLNLYVPNILSCITFDIPDTNTEPATEVFNTLIALEKSKEIITQSTDTEELEEIALVPEPVIAEIATTEVKPAAVVKVKPKIDMKKAAKKAKKH